MSPASKTIIFWFTLHATPPEIISTNHIAGNFPHRQKSKMALAEVCGLNFSENRAFPGPFSAQNGQMSLGTNCMSEPAFEIPNNFDVSMECRPANFHEAGFRCTFCFVILYFRKFAAQPRRGSY